MTEQGERRINQPQCDPTGGKNTALSPVRGWGKGSTCNQGNVASFTCIGFCIAPFFPRLNVISQYQAVQIQGKIRKEGHVQGKRTTTFCLGAEFQLICNKIHSADSQLWRLCKSMF